MGLKGYQLVWHRHGEGWVARAELPNLDTVPSRGKMRTYRFANVNIRPWHLDHRHGKVYVDVSYTMQTHWADSIDDAKIWVEAVFALDND